MTNGFVAEVEEVGEEEGQVVAWLVGAGHVVNRKGIASSLEYAAEGVLGLLA